MYHFFSSSRSLTPHLSLVEWHGGAARGGGAGGAAQGGCGAGEAARRGGGVEGGDPEGGVEDSVGDRDK